MTADSTPDGLLGRVEGTLARVLCDHAPVISLTFNGPRSIANTGKPATCSCDAAAWTAAHVAAMQVAALVDEYGLAEEAITAHYFAVETPPTDVLRLVSRYHPATPSETTEESHD